MSRAKSLALLALGIAIGLVSLPLLIYILVEGTRTGDVVAIVNPRTIALGIAVVGCLLLLPVAVAVRLSRREELVLSRDGFAEVWRRTGTQRAALRWDEIASVTTTKVGRGPHGGTRMVTYTLTQGGRERLEHECAAAGLAPPSWWARQPGAILMKQSYVLGPRPLAELLGTAHQRYSRHVIDG